MLEPLPDNEVQVWQVDLSDFMPLLRRLRLLLSGEEQDRAARFHFEQHRGAFCMSRAVLRVLLESYGVGPAAEIAFTCSRFGKPALAAGQGQPGLEFNLSHTQGRAVYAFTRHRPVGIDVEALRTVPSADLIVAQQFAPEEQAAYHALSEADRQRGFLNGWTRKEAFIKATGEGLQRPLGSFAITLTPGAPVRFLRIDAAVDAQANWQLFDLTLDPSYVVALAVPGADLECRNRLAKTTDFSHSSFHEKFTLPLGPSTR
jgi:4'-phosphopantetheinyl transferase